MYPVLFYIGSLPVFAYGVFILIGMVILFGIAINLAWEGGHKMEQIVPIAMGVIVGGVFGARLSHLLLEPDKAFELLDFYSLFRPGTPGNILGLMIGGYLGGMTIQRRLNYRIMSNYYAPALAAATVVWRIGCTLAGCCYGKETLSFLSIHLHDADVHPTMIYEGVFNLILLPILWRLHNRVRHEEAVLFLYFAAYAFFRFWLEFLRTYPVVALGLTGAQWICLGMLVAVGFWYFRHRQSGSAILVGKQVIT
jgi:phosphatidylglycerol---prolipoprotein diacylglyceryl transferase